MKHIVSRINNGKKYYLKSIAVEFDAAGHPHDGNAQWTSNIHAATVLDMAFAPHKLICKWCTDQGYELE